MPKQSSDGSCVRTGHIGNTVCSTKETREAEPQFGNLRPPKRLPDVLKFRLLLTYRNETPRNAPSCPKAARSAAATLSPAARRAKFTP